MTATLSELVRYRLTRVKETLGEAQTLAQSESWNGTINRLYYACFYAVSAYLLIVGKSSKTHASTKSAFHFNVVKTGLVTVEMGKIYNRLFENRFEGDYEDFVEFDSETVLPLLAQANEISSMLSTKLPKTHFFNFLLKRYETRLQRPRRSDFRPAFCCCHGGE